MTILGIDPGLATVGYGALRYEGGRFITLGYGVLTTPAGMETPERIEMLFDGVNALIDAHSPADMAIEELFFNTNQKTVIDVCQARGAILLCARRRRLGIYGYTPLQVKQAVVGYGRAEKNQVMVMVKNLLRLDKLPRPDDAADALALAICHAHSKRVGSLGK